MQEKTALTTAALQLLSNYFAEITSTSDKSNTFILSCFQYSIISHDYSFIINEKNGELSEMEITSIQLNSTHFWGDFGEC